MHNCLSFMSELARVYTRWTIEADAKRRAAKILADGTRPARYCSVSVAVAFRVDVPVTVFKPVHNKDHISFKAAEQPFEVTANDPREPLKSGDAGDKILASHKKLPFQNMEQISPREVFCVIDEDNLPTPPCDHSGATTYAELEIAMEARLRMGLWQVRTVSAPFPTSNRFISTSLSALPSDTPRRIGSVSCPYRLLTGCSLSLSVLQMMVMAQGRTVMVDVPPGTAVAQFEVLVADRTGLPLGTFGLYHGGHPLRTLEGCFTIELKTRGCGGGDFGSFFDRCCTCFTGANTEGGTSNSTGGHQSLNGDDAESACSSEAPTAPLIEAVTLEQQAYDPRAEGELVTTGGRSGNLPHEIYTALTKFDDGLVEALRAGDIRLVRSEWFLALPDGYRIQRRQDLEALAPASPLLTPDEAVVLLRQGNRGVGSLTYGCALRDSTHRRTPRSA